MTLRHDDERDLDLRARAELALAYEPGQPPAHLLRSANALSRRGIKLCIGALLLLSIGMGGVLAVGPPELVRGAIEHEYYERSLRGSLIDMRSLLQHLGIGQSEAVPGFPQLMRPCDINGHLVYHLTTFFEKGGMVTVFAFDQPISLKEASGWWDNVHWEVITSREGKPLVLVAQQKKALAVARTSFSKPPA